MPRPGRMTTERAKDFKGTLRQLLAAMSKYKLSLVVVIVFADLVAEVVADLLRQAGHEPALNEAERRGQQVHAQQEQQHLADVGKVDAAHAAQLGDPAGGQRRGGLGQDLWPCNVENG